MLVLGEGRESETAPTSKVLSLLDTSMQQRPGRLKKVMHSCCYPVELRVHLLT